MSAIKEKYFVCWNNGFGFGYTTSTLGSISGCSGRDWMKMKPQHGQVLWPLLLGGWCCCVVVGLLLKWPDVEMCVPSTEGGAIRSPPTLIPTVFTAFKFTQTLFIQDHASILWFSHLWLYFWETVTEFYIVCLNSFQSLIRYHVFTVRRISVNWSNQSCEAQARATWSQ